LSDWPTYLALIFGGLLGLLAGNQLAEKVDGTAFHRWLLLFLAAGGLLMLSSGNPVLSGCFAALVAVSALLVLVSVTRGASSESRLMCNANVEKVELQDKGEKMSQPLCKGLEALEARIPAEFEKYLKRLMLARCARRLSIYALPSLRRHTMSDLMAPLNI